MDLVLTGLALKVCLVYLDDIIVLADTFEHHMERLELVFGRLNSEGLKLNPSKCRLIQLKTKLLGNVVSGQGIESDKDKVRAVRDWPIPKKT